MINRSLALKKEMFKRGLFSFITDRDGIRHEKQQEALKALTDNTTVEIGYGGAAGGAKSWTGCTWLVFASLCYPETRWFIGREELKRLRDSTLLTFFKVCVAYGAKKDVDWKYNGQDHYIQFTNGSRIDLLDLKYLPSDPLYERYGSIEYTGGWIEEAGEVDFKAVDVLKSRIGRHLNDKYCLLRKLFITFNPKKNWLYVYFYKRKEHLPVEIKFIQALLWDNPFRESGYENALRSITDPVTKARLLNAEWDYDDDPAALCDYNAIIDCFSIVEYKKEGKKAISADLAMMGRDRFIAGLWTDLQCKIAIDQPLSTGKSIEADIKQIMTSEAVRHKDVIVDSDGLGAYLVSYLEGIETFHGGARAINEKEFANIKSECGYKLAEVINNRELKIICTLDQQERIKDELAVLKADNVDQDEKKKRIIKKEKMKELLGRSPDYLDMLLMGMYFHVKPKYNDYYIDKYGKIIVLS